MKKIITICVLALLIVPVLTVTATENEVLESEIQTISAVRRPTPQSTTCEDEDDVLKSEVQTISSVGNKNLKMLVSEILTILKVGIKNPKMLASEILKISSVRNKKSDMLASEIQTISAVRRPTPQTLEDDDVLGSEIQTISAVRRPTPQTLGDDDEVPVVVNTGQSPSKSVISGPTIGTIGEIYEYTVSSTDPQDNDVYYKISWGDCAVMYWDGPHKSGEEVTYEHAWCSVCFPGGGDFTICVEVKDDDDNNGKSETFEVSMGRGNHQSHFSASFLQFLEKLMERFPILE